MMSFIGLDSSCAMRCVACDITEIDAVTGHITWCPSNNIGGVLCEKCDLPPVTLIGAYRTPCRPNLTGHLSIAASLRPPYDPVSVPTATLHWSTSYD